MEQACGTLEGMAAKNATIGRHVTAAVGSVDATFAVDERRTVDERHTSCGRTSERDPCVEQRQAATKKRKKEAKQEDQVRTME